jgi:hypothetical protein
MKIIELSKAVLSHFLLFLCVEINLQAHTLNFAFNKLESVHSIVSASVVFRPMCDMTPCQWA